MVMTFEPGGNARSPGRRRRSAGARRSAATMAASASTASASSSVAAMRSTVLGARSDVGQHRTVVLPAARQAAPRVMQPPGGVAAATRPPTPPIPTSTTPRGASMVASCVPETRACLAFSDRGSSGHHAERRPRVGLVATRFRLLRPAHARGVRDRMRPSAPAAPSCSAPRSTSSSRVDRDGGTGRAGAGRARRRAARRHRYARSWPCRAIALDGPLEGWTHRSWSGTRFPVMRGHARGPTRGPRRRRTRPPSPA